MRTILAILLMIEGFSTGVGTVTRAPAMAIYPAVTIGVLAVRAVIGIAQFVGGWLLVRRQPPGRAIGRAALIVSAVWLTLELGAGFAPTNVFPTYRWPAVGLYGVYAVAGAWYLTRAGAADSGVM